MSSPSKIYIVILNYNGWQDTIECLESLQQLTYPNFQIIVVDNNSPDGSMDLLTNWASSYFSSRPNGYKVLHETALADTETVISPDTVVTFVQAEKNRGFAAGNNLGIRLAQRQQDYDYLWLLNNDTTVAADSLSALVQQARTAENKGEKVGIWGSKLLYYHQPDTLQATGGKFDLLKFTTSHIAENQKDTGQYDHPELKQDYVVGASMFVSKEFVEKVGLLDENYFLYFEELDWATRGKLLHFKLGFCWSSRVYHKEGKSIGSSSDGGKKSKLADYHGIRSKIIFVRKFYSDKLLQLYVVLIGSMILRISRLQFMRAGSVISLILKKN